MTDYDTAELLEAFDNDYNSADDVSAPIAKCMAFIRDNTGLLGNYNAGDVKLNAGGTTVMVTARSSTMRTDLHQWVQDQSDLKISTIGIKKRRDATVPYLEIKAD